MAPKRATTGKFDSRGTLGNLTHGALEIDAGAANITVAGTSSLEGDLYHATITYSGPKPQVNLDRSDGTLTISQGNSGFGVFQTRRFTLDLQINSTIPRPVPSTGGASPPTATTPAPPLTA